MRLLPLPSLSFVRRGLVPAALCGLLLLPLLAGCTRSEAAEDDAAQDAVVFAAAVPPLLQTTAERDSVLTVLASVNQVPFRRAYGVLERSTYTRYTRTEQLTEADFLIAFDERVEAHTPTGSGIVSADSAGAFDYGYFDHFVSENRTLEEPPDLAQHVLPDEPAFLDPRNRDAYVYRFLPDTLMWDTVARVVEVRAAPKEGDGQNIRRVRLYLDARSNTLIGLYLERVDLAMFFREESRFYVHIRPVGQGLWAPYNTRFETRIRVPFRPAQLFRTVATYYDFDVS